MREYANPSSADPHFIETRHKDWFNGHSWAAGLFEFADNRNQESTSESVNSYYAVMLLGKAMKHTDMYNFGRLLLATEIRSVNYYWHMPSVSDIYPSDFKAKKMVGILWDVKADYATWFGADPCFIHGIQMLPFTPITEEYLPYKFIKEEYPVVPRHCGASDWDPYMTMDQAIVDQSGAWSRAQGLNRFHNGLSKTNMLWWIATRPPPNREETEQTPETRTFLTE